MSTPKAFICHSSQDKAIVQEIATGLRSGGVDAWLDKWEILPDDSLRRKVEEGVEGSSIFIPVLTPSSIESKWVKQEIDGAFIKTIEGTCKIIPVFLNIEVENAPLLLRSKLGVKCADVDVCIKELCDAIFKRSEKPPVAVETERPVRLKGLSENASRIAHKLCKSSEVGSEGIDFVDSRELQTEFDLSSMLLKDVVDELEQNGFVKVKLHSDGFRLQSANPLFWNLDPDVMGWSVDEDAKTVAGVIVNSTEQVVSVSKLAEVLSWEPRRLNPAVTYLVDQGYVDSTPVIGSYPYAHNFVMVSAKTRRYCREHSS